MTDIERQREEKIHQNDKLIQKLKKREKKKKKNEM